MIKTNNTQESWEEEFDEIFNQIEPFGSRNAVIYGRDGSMRFDESGNQLGAIKNFIRQTITHHESLLLERVNEVVKKTTHKEGFGSYCDTGADMDWACRSECTEEIKDNILQSLNSLTPKK